MIAFNDCNPIIWSSKKQSCVALSSMEAEYYAAAIAGQEAINCKGILNDFKCEIETVLIKVDNSSAVALIKTYQNSKRAKHIDVRAHFLKDLFEKHIIDVKQVDSYKNNADFLTKSLSKQLFRRFRGFRDQALIIC